MQSSSDAYAQLLHRYLPPGILQQIGPDSRLGQVLRAIADFLFLAHHQGLRLLRETDPRTTSQLLPEWERTVGLPGPCTGLAETIQQRRDAVVQALVATGGATPAYFAELAAALGYDVTITEFASAHEWTVNAAEDVAITEFRAGQSTAGEPLRAWGNEQLECVIERLKPAHTTVVFAYGSP